MKTIAVVPGALALAIANILFVPAYAADDATPAADQGQNATELPKVEVREHSQDDTRPKLQYIMKEVDGPLITVTKKTTVTKLDNIPTIVDNNLRDLFAQTPGLYYSEQQSPGQLNLSYRGIGNPQESEFVTVMLDGIPLEGDWVGFPTVYTFPLPQTLSQIQMIRGGSSLLYGPEPPPAINLISRKPVADREFSGYTENVAGSNGMFGTFNEVSGTKDSWDYLADINYRKDDGQRDNGESELAGGDMHVGYRTDDVVHRARSARVRSRHGRSGQAQLRAVPAGRGSDHDAVQQALDRSLRAEPQPRAEIRRRFGAVRQGLVRLSGPGFAFAGSRQSADDRDAAGREIQLHRHRRALGDALGTRQCVHDRHDAVSLRCAVPAVGRGQPVAGSLRPLRRSVRRGDPGQLREIPPAALVRLRRGLRRERVPLGQWLAHRSVGAHRS